MGTYIAGGIYKRYVSFDGNDYLTTSGLTESDSKSFTLSFWFIPTLDGNDRYIMRWNGGRFTVSLNSSARFRIDGYDDSGELVVRMEPEFAATISSGSAYHLLVSCDVANDEMWARLNDVASTNMMNAEQDASIEFSNIDDSGYIAGLNGGSTNNYKGSLFRLWFDVGTYLEETEGNRRKFITAGGVSARLGKTGAIPTGSTPALYFDGSPAIWANNKGDSGVYTLTGELTAGNAAPL